MDPLTAAAISTALVPIVTGAAGEAGKAAWASLAAWAKSRFPSDRATIDAVETLEQRPDDREAADELAERLAASARANADDRAWLDAWRAGAAEITATSVTNTVSGTVHGNLVQGNTFRDISFGTPPSR